MEAVADDDTTPAPSLRDVLLALAVAVTCLLPLVVARSSVMLVLEPRALMICAVLVGSAALVLRRRFPWAVWFAATVVGLVAVAAGGGPTPAYLPSVVALCSVTVVTSRHRAFAATLTSMVGPVAVVLIGHRDNAFDSVAFGMTAWSGLALMSGLAVRGQRAAVESAQERARLAESTREEEAQRRVTEERVRIARELHDVVAHHVSVINVQAGVASYLVRSDPDGAAEAMTHVREASQTVLDEVATVLGLLRSTEDVETAPLPGLAELDDLIEQVRRAGVRVVVQATGPGSQLSALVDLTAYRVVQEALTNAGRHGSGSASVRLERAADTLTIEVRNPRNPSTPGPAGTGHGLVGMRERVTAAGGTLVAGPDGASAWLVRAVLPVVPIDTASAIPVKDAALAARRPEPSR